MDRESWERLRPLMDRALELTVSERQDWIEALRRESPTIARELESLLREEGTLDRRGFLDTPPTDIDALIARLGAAQSTGYQQAQLATALANRYTLGAPLGRGGMATVFRARDDRHGRDVAIKVIRPDAASAVGAERFLAEIRLTAQLTHPNILPLIDSGESGGVLYYVMPFIEGESLRARLRRDGALPVDDVLRAAHAVGEALAYAHSKGAVHRDIKPDNVLVSGRQAWVADFGIAKAMANSALTKHAVTSVGVTLGSPGYMAPEQIEGTDRVDHRADIYSLGATLWELLAGRPVFEGTTMQQLFSQHMTAQPTAIDAVVPGVPPALAGAIMRCLEKDADLRWQSAEEFLQALEGVGGVSGARLVSSPRLSRRAVWLGAGATVAVGMAAAALMLPRGSGFVPLERPFRFATVSDIDSDVTISPDGTLAAFRRRGAGRQPDENRFVIWIQHRDSAVPFRLADSAEGRLAWLSDSLLAVVRPRSPLRVLALATRRDSALSHLAGAEGAWFVAQTGLLLHAVAGDGGRLLHVRRADSRGWSDSMTIQRDSGERTSCLLRVPAQRAYVMCTLMPDSSMRLSSVSLSGQRTTVHEIPADTVRLRPYLQRTPLLQENGRFLDFWIRVDSIRRYDMKAPTAPAIELGGPLPGVLFEYTRQGYAVVRRPGTIGTMWRFPVLRPEEARELERQAGLEDAGISSDGVLQARVERGDREALVMMSTVNGSRRVIAESNTFLRTPVWSPDGTRVAYRLHSAGKTTEWVVHDTRDGSSSRFGTPSTPVSPGARIAPFGLPPAWSPDGRFLYAVEMDSVIRRRVRRFNTSTSGDSGVTLVEMPEILRDRSGADYPHGLAVSPDGVTLAIGGVGITLVPTAGGPARVLIPPDTSRGFMPVTWLSPTEIAYVTGSTYGLDQLWKVTTAGVRSSIGRAPEGCQSVFSVIRSGPDVVCVAPEPITEAWLYNPITPRDSVRR